MKKNIVTNKKVEIKEVNNEIYVIENNVPIPEKTVRSGKKGQFRLTIEKMNVGDSFIIPSVPKSYYTAQKLTGVKLIKQQNEDGTTRIWRKA